MNVQTTSGEWEHVPPGRLWFGATGAAIAWAVQGFTCFLISTQACANGRGSWGPLSPLGVRIVLGCVAFGFLSIAAASTLVSYSNWRHLSEQRRLLQDEGLAREDFMSLTGIFVGAACIIGLVWAGIPPIFFEVCNTWR